MNQYASITGQNAERGLAYDDDGNMTKEGTWGYAYDAEKRLKSMFKSDQSISFTYDYLGRRARKVVTGSGAQTVKYIWNGSQLVAELALRTLQSAECNVQSLTPFATSFNSSMDQYNGAAMRFNYYMSGGWSAQFAPTSK